MWLSPLPYCELLHTEIYCLVSSLWLSIKVWNTLKSVIKCFWMNELKECIWIKSFMENATKSFNGQVAEIIDKIKELFFRNSLKFQFLGGGGPCHTECGILVPRPGNESTPPVMEVQSLNCWTTRQAPNFNFFLYSSSKIAWKFKISIPYLVEDLLTLCQEK